jgi:hypothetical protein
MFTIISRQLHLPTFSTPDPTYSSYVSPVGMTIYPRISSREPRTRIAMADVPGSSGEYTPEYPWLQTSMAICSI